jgi:N-acetylmuramoyl-L-alanine amidase
VQRIIFYCLYGFIILLPLTSWSKTAATGYRFADSMEYSRFVLDISKKASFSVLTLDNPDRLVIDIKDGAWGMTKSKPTESAQGSTIVKEVRHGIKNGKDLRIVLDLFRPVTVKSSFQIPPRDGKSYRIVVDMLPRITPASPASLPPHNNVKDAVKTSQMPSKEPTESAPKPVVQLQQYPPLPVEAYSEAPSPLQDMPLPVIPSTVTPPAVKMAAPYAPKPPPPLLLQAPMQELPATALTPIQRVPVKPLPAMTPVPVGGTKKLAPVMQRPLIILDPGHGGDDPGTIGRSYKTYEKTVTMQYALLLKKRLEKSGRYRVEMTRNADYFIRLEERVNKAREKQADIFISLHADSHPQPAMRGLSVYTLSETSSDKESEALAAKENKSDIIKGVDLKGESSEVASLLINLQQRETKNNSAEFAEIAVSELAKTVNVLPNTHRFAGFRVLKGIDVPAVLIELGYLSNKEEEKLLTSKAYQKKIIEALIMAIDRHFKVQKTAKALM